jgi:hypothetical protein
VSQALMDYVIAMHDVEVAVTELRLAELNLSDEHSSALAVNHAQDKVAVAARRLTLAVDALPLNRQPIGWGDAQ